jgi:hypothetical protein
MTLTMPDQIEIWEENKKRMTKIVSCCECKKTTTVYFLALDYSRVVCDKCNQHEYKDGEEDFLNKQQ